MACLVPLMWKACAPVLHTFAHIVAQIPCVMVPIEEGSRELLSMQTAPSSLCRLHSVS